MGLATGSRMSAKVSTGGFAEPRPGRARRYAGTAKTAALLAKDAGLRWAGDECYRLAASLAFAALYSLFPLLLLLVTGIGFLLGDDEHVRHRVVASVAGGASPESRALLDQALQSMQTHRTARGLGAAVGFVTLLIGASGVFSELEASLNTIWRVRAPENKGLWATVVRAAKGKAFAFSVVLAAAAALLLSLGMSTVLGAIASSSERVVPGAIPWRAVDAGVSLGFLTLLIAAIYRVVPQTRVAWGDVLGAALVASLLFTALKYLFAWYLSHVASYAAYGVVGAFLGLMTWIYLAGMVLLYGAELSRVYAERFGSVARAAATKDAGGPASAPSSDG
jgi:membrane protein